jgi:hypothetical protein
MNELNPYNAPNPQPVDDPPLIAQLSAEEGMTVEFEQTLEDVLALQFCLARARGDAEMPRGVLIFIAVASLSLLVPAAFFATIPYWREEALEGLIGGLLIAGLGVAAYFGVPAVSRWFLRISIRKLVKKTHNRNLVGERRITIAPEYVVCSSPGIQQVARWTGVERVLIEKDYLFIFLTALDALVLPRRAFNSEQHFREYALLAEKYRQAGGA